LEKLPLALRNFIGGLKPIHQRILMAVVMAVAALGAIYIGGFLFSLLLIAGAILGAREWIRLTQKDLLSYHMYVFYAVLAVSVLVCDFISFKIAFLCLCVFTYLLKWILDHDGVKTTKLFLSGVFYLGLPCISILWLRQEGELFSHYDWAAVILLFVSVWATDSCAYFAGRTFGGPKLAPTISPNKTISGLLGGIFGSALATLAMAALFGFNWWGVYFIIGMLLAIVAQMGDLFESWIKRRADVKDSGTLIPGHGGILDRIDGLLAAAPLLAFILAMIV
jgi:phosphatidate cytidylyltransferase